MDYRQFGQSGLKVSELGLGTLTFGSKTPAWDAQQIMDHFIHNGGTLIDTSDRYGNGKAEAIIGQWMSNGNHRPHVIIATKGGGKPNTDPNRRGLSRHAMIHLVDDSLQRLQTDYIDIYYPEFWDATTPLEETLYTLETLIQQGKIRYLACTNWQAWQLSQALTHQQLRHWSPFVALQLPYNLLERSYEHQYQSLIEYTGLGVIAAAPNAGGFLTGKYHQNQPFDKKDRFFDEEHPMTPFYHDMALNNHGWLMNDLLHELAHTLNTTPRLIALSWVLQQPRVASALIGISYIHQIDENMEPYKITLDAETLGRLNHAIPKPNLYPANTIDWLTP